MVYLLFTIAGFIVCVGLVLYLRHFAPLRKIEDGFEYVFVNDDGSVRELTEDERKYLKQVFHPNDGAPPYIKSRYNQLTPDGRLSGFIARRRVPSRIKIDDMN